MSKQCAQNQLEFQGLGSRRVVASFDGGTITSDAGGLLLREVDVRVGVLDAFAACFVDRREPCYAEHPVRQLVAQRVYGLCLGYEDLNDHEQLRYDPLFAALCAQDDVQGSRRRRESDQGKALAGKATLQRLESAPAEDAKLGRYHRIFHKPEAVQKFFVEHFLSNYNSGRQPGQIVIDLDATDDPIHGGLFPIPECGNHKTFDPAVLSLGQPTLLPPADMLAEVLPLQLSLAFPHRFFRRGRLCRFPINTSRLGRFDCYVLFEPTTRIHASTRVETDAPPNGQMQRAPQVEPTYPRFRSLCVTHMFTEL